MGGPVSGFGQYSWKLNGMFNYFHVFLQHHIVDIFMFVIAFFWVLLDVVITIIITTITSFIFIFITFEYSSSSSVLLHLLIEELQDTDLTFSSIWASTKIKLCLWMKYAWWAFYIEYWMIIWWWGERYWLERENENNHRRHKLHFSRDNVVHCWPA